MPKRNDGADSRDIVPVTGEYPHPMIPEGYGEYYYGRVVSKSAVARAYLQLFARRRKLLLTTFFSVLVLGLCWIFTRPTQYRSIAEMLVVPTSGTQGNGENLAQDIGAMTHVRSVATEMRLLNSPDLLDEAFSALPSSLRLQGFGTHAASLERYPVTITNPRDTDVIAVSVTARNAAAAAAFANGILQTNIDRAQETTRRIAEVATKHVDSELTQCDSDLRDALARMAQIKQGRAVVDITTQASTDAQALANLESQVTQARSELVRARVSRQMLERELRKTSAAIIASVTSSDNPVLQTVNNELERLQQQRASLLQEYLPTSPEVRNVDQLILEAKKRKSEAMASRVESVTQGRNPLLDKMQENYINAVVAEQESAGRVQINEEKAREVRTRIASLPKIEEAISLLTSRISELQSTHAYLTNQKQALTLSMHGGLPNTMPITKARANPLPVSPNIITGSFLLVVVAVLLAVGLAVLCDQLDDSIHTADMLETSTGRRVLASIPQIRNGMHGLATDPTCPSALLESYRILRGNILLSMPDPLPKLIMVTSAKAGEGKSTTVANLASAIALSGKRVLIIDCDMRHPSMHTIYQLDNAIGLSSVLQGEATLEKGIASTSVEGVTVLPAGPSPCYPPELLTMPRMRTLLSTVSADYDCVLLDSPPMLNLSDGSLLAALADSALLVVSSERTHNADLQTALRSLEIVGVSILGLVYNRANDGPALVWEKKSVS